MKEIKLTKGKFALVDDADYQWLNQWKWFAVKRRRTFYAMRVLYKKSKYHCTVIMHRLILGITDIKIDSDHIDHNGLNNQRYNLREATHRENMKNRSAARYSTSKYLGVSKRINSDLWRAKLQSNGISIHIGYFIDEKDAALAYNKAAIARHGEFANLNIV